MPLWSQKTAAGVRTGSKDAFNFAIFWVYIAGLAWAPFWFGANELVAWGINGVLFPGLAVIYEISVLIKGESHPVGIRELKFSATLFFAVAFWIVVQNATWTPTVLHHPIWAMAAEALNTPVDGSISVNRDLTALALLRLVTAASVFWIAVQLCRDASRAYQFIAAFIAISVGYASYGLIAFAFAQSENFSRNFLVSTFYNHNHYATFAGLGLIAVVGLILRSYRRQLTTAGGSLRYRIATFIEATGQKTTVLLGSAFLIFITLLLTGSRGGIIATGLGLLTLGVLASGNRLKSAKGFLGAIAIGAVGVGICILTFGDMFVAQVTEKGLVDSYRLAVHEMTIRSIFDAPILGYGYGTFADVFPMFRDRSISVQGVWEQAHNTYLEVFQGLGLVFGSMLIGSVVMLVAKCCRGATRRQGITIPGIAAAAAVLVGVHSLVDFSLQIQAVTIMFMSLLGAGVAQSQSRQLAFGD